jgi:hypothetical protein
MMTMAAKLLQSPALRQRGPQTSVPMLRPLPNPTPAREALQHALTLLETPDDPAALVAARQAAWNAVGLIPYPWQAPDCESTRQGWQTPTCLSPGCTRCAAYEVGNPMHADDH